MPNPFPGVNPHIEATADLWVGFHNVLIGQVSILLNADLMSRGYAAFVDKRVELVSAGELDGVRIPDVSVTRPDDVGEPWAGRSTTSSSGSAAVLDVEPVDVENPAYEEVSLAFIEVRRLPGQELVIGIKLLSPANKGSGRREYDAKRAELLRRRVNLVEVDLLLGGRLPELSGPVPGGHFHAFVTRAQRPRLCKAYAWSVRQPLPRLPIPLLPGDDEAVLDLAAAYRMTYDGGPYRLVLPYDRPLPGSLSDADRAWVAERVASVGRR